MNIRVKTMNIQYPIRQHLKSSEFAVRCATPKFLCFRPTPPDSIQYCIVRRFMNLVDFQVHGYSMLLLLFANLRHFARLTFVNVRLVFMNIRLIFMNTSLIFTDSSGQCHMIHQNVFPLFN